VVRGKIIIIVLAVVIGGTLLVRHIIRGEERRVLDRFDALSEWISKDSSENIVQAAQRLRGLRALFDKTCALEAHKDYLSGNYTPEEMVGIAVRARTRFKKLSLMFYDINVEFINDVVAEVKLTGRLTGLLTNNEPVNEIRELESALKKLNGEWRFSRISVVEVLER